ncbi:hypothetical protein [Tenacibaculum sp. 190524A05c]|uniref:YhhN-like protein n=1 Tax=Tenacibaculum platacis TaxID=3137852 RepID=A0ABP1EK28_9FLAO
MRLKQLFFALFILLSIMDVSIIMLEFKEALWLPRSLSLISIVLYGYYSIKDVPFSFWVLSFFIVSTGFLFSLDDYTLIGMLSLIGLRLSWTKLIFDINTKIDKTILSIAFAITTAMFGVILYLLYTDSIFYYLSIATTLGLVLLLSTSFSLLTTKGMKFGNKEMIISIGIFILSDALSGSKKIAGTSLFYIILSVVLYNTAYYFLMRALIKNISRNRLNS